MRYSKEIMDEYKKEIGQKFLSRDGSIEGTVKTISSRYCAACGIICTCYIVQWSDNSVTKPCARGVIYNANGVLQIS